MTDYPGSLPPAGWYPDPYGAPYERWWDGAQWTDHTNVPAAPEPVAATPVVPEPAPVEPVAPNHATTEPAYTAPEERYPEQRYTAPSQTTEPAYQAPQQEQSYKAPAEPQSAWNTPATPATSFDDIFATGQAQPTAAETAAATQTSQPAFTQPAPAAYGQPEQQPYQTASPAYDPYAAQQAAQPQAQSFLPASTGADADFGELIAGGGASGSSDPFTSWSNQDYDEPPRNTPATVGLTFGVLSFIIPGVAGLVGLITSALGLRRAAELKREEGAAIGQGKSIAGIALSVIGTAASIAVVLLVLPGLINPAASNTGASSELVANLPKTDVGNIAMEEGTAGTIYFAGTTDPSIQFTVTGVTPAPECTEDPELVLSPENGQFVALTMEFTTSADYLTSMASGAPLQVSMSDFVGHADGSTLVNTDNGLSCIPESEQLVTEIPAGETVTGTVILDLSETATSFSYSPSGVTGLESTTRWEWAIPRA